MDYGQTIPPTDLPEALTPGSNSHTLEAKDNLDLTNQADQWGEMTKPIEHDKQSLGSEALNSFELPSSESERELGKITPYLPPDATPEAYGESAANPKSDAGIIENSLNPSLGNIKTTERLNDEGIKTFESLKEQIEQGEISLADGYDSWQKMAEENRSNSFNGKIGEEKVA